MSPISKHLAVCPPAPSRFNSVRGLVSDPGLPLVLHQRMRRGVSQQARVCSQEWAAATYCLIYSSGLGFRAKDVLTSSFDQKGFAHTTNCRMLLIGRGLAVYKPGMLEFCGTCFKSGQFTNGLHGCFTACACNHQLKGFCGILLAWLLLTLPDPCCDFMWHCDWLPSMCLDASMAPTATHFVFALIRSLMFAVR